MRNLFVVSLWWAAVALSGGANGATGSKVPASTDAAAKLLVASSAFVENVGQWNSQAQFLSQTPGANVWVTRDGLVIDLHRSTFDPKASEIGAGPRVRTVGNIISATFAGANERPGIGMTELHGKYNYMFGNDHSRWGIGARRFAEVRSMGIYDGISARYYTENGVPRYDLLVKPGADPSQIAMKLNGARSLEVADNGDFRIQTSLGPLLMKGLAAYQEHAGLRTEIPCRMVAEGNNLRFDLSAYDRSKELVIDPLIFSTYLPGIGGGSILPVSPVGLDASGNILVAGCTQATNMPLSVGAYDSTNNVGSYEEGYVLGLSKDGSTLNFCTYFGGLGQTDTVPQAIASDSQGNVVIAGYTGLGNNSVNQDSDTFPTTSGAYQTNPTNPDWVLNACFVSRLSSDGTQLVSSTLLYDPAPYDNVSNTNYVMQEGARGLAIDSNDNAIIVGFTEGNYFPVTPNAIQLHKLSTVYYAYPGESSCFISMISPDGKKLLNSTYLGGTGAYLDGGTAEEANNVVLDSSGNMFLVGATYSQDFPVTAGAYQTHNAAYGGISGVDPTGATMFVSEISSDWSHLVFSTYLGGSATRAGGPGAGSVSPFAFIALDSAGNPVISSAIFTANFPVTAGAYQAQSSQGPNFFVAKLSADGGQLLDSSAIGGGIVTGMALDSSDNPVVSGYTQVGWNLPTTPGAVMSAPVNVLPYANAFVLKLPAGQSELLYSSCLPGNFGYGLVLDSAGDAIVNGNVQVTNMQTTPGAYETAAPYSTGGGFLSKLTLTADAPSLSLGSSAVIGGVTSPSGQIKMSYPWNSPITVHLHSSNSAASVPSTVSILAGQTTASFTVTTSAVSSVANATILASTGNLATSKALAVYPKPTVETLSLGANAVVGGTKLSNCAFSLTNPSPNAPITITLAANNSAATLSETSIILKQGVSTGAFSISTSEVAVSTQATITASANGLGKAESLMIYPLPVANLTLVKNVVVGGLSASGAVSLSAAAPLALSVEIRTSNTNVVANSSVAFAVGKQSSTFVLATKPVTASVLITISATTGQSLKYVALDVNASDPLSSLTVAEPSISSGQTVKASVSLTAPAPPGGIMTAISASGGATVAPLVPIAAGATSATFLVTAPTVNVQTPVTITASDGGTVTKSATLTVTVPLLTSLNIIPISVVGGSNSDAAVHVSVPAGASGDVITISSNSPDAIVQHSMTILVGKTFNTFPIKTLPVNKATVVAITVSYAGTTLSKTLTVTP